MINFPKELEGVTFIDDEGNRQLRENATEEQRSIFKKFYRDIENENLTDTILEIEE